MNHGPFGFPEARPAKEAMRSLRRAGCARIFTSGGIGSQADHAPMPHVSHPAVERRLRGLSGTCYGDRASHGPALLRFSRAKNFLASAPSNRCLHRLQSASSLLVDGVARPDHRNLWRRSRKRARADASNLGKSSRGVALRNLHRDTSWQATAKCRLRVLRGL